ncbi:conjugal transfer protein TrbL [Sesbania bispinosa]|nr:conjugal transfer protein TrbL [Sesbania bispinosa]
MPIPCYVALFLALASAFCINAFTTDAKLQDQTLLVNFFFRLHCLQEIWLRPVVLFGVVRRLLSSHGIPNMMWALTLPGG